jgi:hypothetical protein
MRTEVIIEYNGKNEHNEDMVFVYDYETKALRDIEPLDAVFNLYDVKGELIEGILHEASTDRIYYEEDEMVESSYMFDENFQEED